MSTTYNWKEIWDISQAVLSWISIMEASTLEDKKWAVKYYEAGHTPHMNNLLHSSLFKRILEKKKVFTYPPPKSYSTPWYSLLENKKEEIGEFSFYTLNGKDYVSINHAQWEVLSQDTGRYNIKYTIEGDIYYLAELTIENNSKYITLTHNPNE